MDEPAGAILVSCGPARLMAEPFKNMVDRKLRCDLAEQLASKTSSSSSTPGMPCERVSDKNRTVSPSLTIESRSTKLTTEFVSDTDAEAKRQSSAAAGEAASTATMVKKSFFMRFPRT